MNEKINYRTYKCYNKNIVDKKIYLHYILIDHHYQLMFFKFVIVLIVASVF